MVSAVSAAGGSHSSGYTGTVTVAVFVVITAVVMSVVGMPSFFGTAFHGADRATGIDCRSCLAVMMAVGRNRHNEEDGYQCDRRRRAKQFSD